MRKSYFENNKVSLEKNVWPDIGKSKHKIIGASLYLRHCKTNSFFALHRVKKKKTLKQNNSNKTFLFPVKYKNILPLELYLVADKNVKKKF